MEPSEIPEEVARFILERVRSVWMLETLILLVRQEDRDWSAQEIAGKLRSHPSAIQDCLNELLGASIVRKVGTQPGGRYAIALGEGRRAEALRALPGIYQKYSGRVIQLIYSDRREGALRAFAEAFRFKAGSGAGSGSGSGAPGGTEGAG